jgi:hypothetical protein
MALSDRERRLLAEMEAALASDDPRLQSTLSGGDTATLLRKAPGGALAGIAIIVAGIATLFAGLISQVTLLGMGGFILALVGLLLTLRALSQKGISAPRAPKAPRNLSARIQDRWDKREFDR